MAGNVINSTFINSGRESLSLAASGALGPFAIGSARLVGVRCSFASKWIKAVTLGDGAGTLTLTSVAPGDQGLSIEILASAAGTALGVTVSADGAIVVQLTATTGDSCAEIAAAIAASSTASALVTAVASGSGDTTSAVAAADLASAFDAVGTLAVKVGPAGKLSTVAFKDDSGDTVESKAVAAGDDGSTFLFDGIETADGNVSLVWTRTSGGTNDSVLAEVVAKGG